MKSIQSAWLSSLPAGSAKTRVKGEEQGGTLGPPEMEMNLRESSHLGECVLLSSVFMFLEEAWLCSGMGPSDLGAGCSLQRGAGGEEGGHFSKPHPPQA